MKLIVPVLCLILFVTLTSAADRYEAEDAVVDENSVVKVADEKASGGFYINMKEGALLFKITVGAAGYYTVWTSYSQPSDSNGKIQNLTINGLSTGQVSFPKVDTFVYVKASSKVKLTAGSNTIGITKSWGWVNIDYLEVTPYTATPFTISPALVTPNASENARKMFGFILQNFQKKVISGVMTNTVFYNDGKYTPYKVEEQTEVAWIINASKKTPALLGLDFMHGTGMNADQQWHEGYTAATLGMAEDIYKKGGIPAYCWHWKDPFKKVETFYSPSSNNTPFTDFNLKRAYTDSTTCTVFNTSSDEYKAIVADIDSVAGYLKVLADKKIPVLWRPVHEASGKWFWWGYSGAAACKGLYRFMFDRLTTYHKLDNLIWVWTTDEAGDALSWYPGDEYVDIIGRDYYYYPREANHNSLVASFEKVKELFGGRKVVTLSENGSVPFPDDMSADGAGWSYFMPWYGDYTMDGWAHDNTAADWNKIMNSEYVITLDEMPGWETYVVPVEAKQLNVQKYTITVHSENRRVVCSMHLVSDRCAVTLIGIDGRYVTTLKQGSGKGVAIRFISRDVSPGVYVVKIQEQNRLAECIRTMVR